MFARLRQKLKILFYISKFKNKILLYLDFCIYFITLIISDYLKKNEKR